MDFVGESEITDMSPPLRDLIAKRLAVMIAPVYKPEMLSTAAAQWDLAFTTAQGTNQEKVYIKPTAVITDVN